MPAWPDRIALLFRVVIAVILGQTLFFKFSYGPETQVIFAEMGGRAGATLVGLVELACVVMIIVPRTSALGALAALGTMVGALLSHVFVFGIEVVNPTTGQGDHGALFAMGILVATLSAAVVSIRRDELIELAG